MWDADDDLPSAVERFVALIHQEDVELDRYLATVLFTDIVDSPAGAAAAGDQAWAALLEQHHRVVRGHLARYRGTEMDTAGCLVLLRCVHAVMAAPRGMPSRRKPAVSATRTEAMLSVTACKETRAKRCSVSAHRATAPAASAA